MIKSALLFTILQGLDILTTCIGGIQNEVNPVGIFFGAYGLWGLIAMKGLACLHFTGVVIPIRWLHTPLERYVHKSVLWGYVLVILWNSLYIWRSN